MLIYARIVVPIMYCVWCMKTNLLERMLKCQDFGQIIQPASNMAFEYRLASQDGASFTLFKQAHHTETDVIRAKRYLYNTEDVVSVRVEVVS